MKQLDKQFERRAKRGLSDKDQTVSELEKKLGRLKQQYRGELERKHQLQELKARLTVKALG